MLGTTNIANESLETLEIMRGVLIPWIDSFTQIAEHVRPLTIEEQYEYEHLQKRLDSICDEIATRNSNPVSEKRSIWKRIIRKK
jgi:hypothetical protein